MRHHPVAIALVALAITSMMIGCATPPPTSSEVGEQEVRNGRISFIEALQIESDEHMGLGWIRITQPPNLDLRVGDDVRIEGTGSGGRVVRR
jgi:hypothetical protein